MGMWGYRPLQNDEALDILDRPDTQAQMINELTQAIVVENRYYSECNGPYMVVGILLDSLLPDTHKKFNFDINKMYTDIKKRVYNKDTDDKFMVAKSDALVASIPVEMRESLLEVATVKLKETLDSPRSYNSEYTREMKKWYEEAYQLIQNGFKDVINPAVLSKEDAEWAVQAREQYNNNAELLSIKKAFPNGALILTSNNRNYDFIMNSHHSYISGNPVIAPDKPYWYTPFDDKGVLYEKQMHPELKVAQCDVKKAFNTLYKKGFVVDKCEDGYYKIYSLDLNSYILSGSPDKPLEKGEVVRFIKDNIEQLRKVAKVYNSMAEANAKQLAQFHALRKIYDKSGRKIIGYTITDGKSTKNVQINFLKQAIANKQATFDNLTLASDGRLIMR